jgi:uncharacterized BrkB/YihY/UPF0761 family membrane protein
MGLLFSLFCNITLCLLVIFMLVLFWLVFKKDESLVKRLKNIHEISEQAIEDGTIPAADGALAFIVCESNLELKK